MTWLRALEAASAWESKLALRRTAVLAITLWMTWRVTVWSFAFTHSVLAAKGDMLGAAAMLGAVTAPLAALQGYVFKVYVAAKEAP